MQIIPQVRLSVSGDVISTSPSRPDNRRDETLPLALQINDMVSVTNSPELLSSQSSSRAETGIFNRAWYGLKNYFSPHMNKATTEVVALREVLAKGQLLRQDLDEVTEQLHQGHQFNEPIFSLKRKTSMFIGIVLVLTGSAGGVYQWRKAASTAKEDSGDFNGVNKQQYKTNRISFASHSNAFKCNEHDVNRRCQRQYEKFRHQYPPPENLKGKDLLSLSLKTELNPDELNNREVSYHESFTTTESIDIETEASHYQDSIQTIQRWRNRLIGYIHSHIDVPENIDNKYLAQKILSLITMHTLHENKIAHIYLYGTGLYGERSGETMSADVQRQLVGDLLSKLLYGQSIEDYLVNFFALNRYVSIKYFRRNIIDNKFPFTESDSGAEIKIFHDRYLIPGMPILSLQLSDYSNILVGSVTWFLIYLCSDSEWLDAIKYREVDAVMHGIDVLNHFIYGNLTQGSKNKIHMGLKFTGLYFNLDTKVQELPNFQMLWNEFREALIKRVSLSTEVVDKLRMINKNMKAIGNTPWASRHEYANYMLRKFCKKENPVLYFFREGRMTDTTKNEFIASTKEQAWCVITKNNKRLHIKIPTIKYKYERLSNDAFVLIKLTGKILIGNALRRSDYYNDKLAGDDYSFIDKSALEVISIKVNEVRAPQEMLIGPVLREIKTKEQFIFLRAIHQGENRTYALDKTHKSLIQRVIIDYQNLKKSLAHFFDGWYSRPGWPLQLIMYKDKGINVSISEQDPTALFVERIVDYNVAVVKGFIRKHDKALSNMDTTIVNIMKELFIPFYSCVTSLDGDDAADAFTSCLLDGIFLVLPAGGKAVNTARKLNERVIDISFMIKKNQSFRKDGSILWSKVINDFHIYNIILNEQAILRSSVVDLLLGSLDPGIGLMKEVKDVARSTAITIMKGGLIRLPLTSLKHFKNIAEFSIKAKSIVDSSKKIAVKVSRPSGRLTSHYHYLDNETSSFPSLYGSAYQFGDYYAYYSNRFDVDMILGITDETTDEEENIYVTLSEDEFNGVIFKCVCKETKLSLCNMVPIAAAESNATKVISSVPSTAGKKGDVLFRKSTPEQFANLVIYPHHQILLFEDNVAKNKLYNLLRIDAVHYLFDVENKVLRLLYDGDETEVKKRYQGDKHYQINRNNQGDLLIREDDVVHDAVIPLFNHEYTYGGYFPLTASDMKKNKMSLSFISDKLFLNYHGGYYQLEMTKIRNQFSVSDVRHFLPSFIIGWHSLENNFAAAKPYLKKSSPHIGLTLEDRVDESCGYGGELKKFPTLLLSGAVSAQFNAKLRILNMHYSLGQPINDLFPMECKGFRSPMFFWLYYDLFTESFELSSSHQSLIPPKNYTASPYEVLISQIFSREKFPDMAEIINLNTDQYNNKLAMRMRQAAFLQRLNSVDRWDTLQLPLVQIYSWELHPDVQPFQKKYPAIALWMTWQRQLHRLLKSKLSHELPLIRRAHLQNNAHQLYTSGLLLNSQYSYHEAVWSSQNETKKSIIFHDNGERFYSEALDSDVDQIEWIAKAKYANPFPVTQFMYEINVLPKITVNKESNSAKIQDCYLGTVRLERYTESAEIEYFIMSANGEWLASIDNQHHLLIYNLHEKNIVYTQGKESIVYSKLYSKLDEHAAENYGLFSLTDTGVLYYPKDNVWVENNGDRALWSPPINYFPSFISQDQRFLGFKHQNKTDIILYDQKRQLMALLTCPLSHEDNVNITAVAFSALNAVIAVAFDDGHVYLYDLITERSDTTRAPVAHIKLNNIINNTPNNHILMRFEGVFDTLTIIHPVGLFVPYRQDKDIIYVRSSYGFHDNKAINSTLGALKKS